MIGVTGVSSFSSELQKVYEKSEVSQVSPSLNPAHLVYAYCR